MPPTITEQLTQISARLDLLHDNMNKRFDMQDMRFDTQDIDIAALHDQIQTGQLDTILNINEGRDAIAALSVLSSFCVASRYKTNNEHTPANKTHIVASIIHLLLTQWQSSSYHYTLRAGRLF